MDSTGPVRWARASLVGPLVLLAKVRVEEVRGLPIGAVVDRVSNVLTQSVNAPRGDPQVLGDAPERGTWGGLVQINGLPTNPPY